MSKHEAIVKRSGVVWDAWVRACRTFYTLVGIDILFAVGTGLNGALNDGMDVMSGEFWVFALGLVVKSLVAGIATFFLRLRVTPKNSHDDRGYTVVDNPGFETTT